MMIMMIMMGTVTRSDDFFDCHPAIQTAFKYTKVITNWGKIENEEFRGLKKRESLDFDEFKTFLLLLRQYYCYCQVNKALTNALNTINSRHSPTTILTRI